MRDVQMREDHLVQGHEYQTVHDGMQAVQVNQVEHSLLH